VPAIYAATVVAQMAGLAGHDVLGEGITALFAGNEGDGRTAGNQAVSEP
jgi:hypothetical protein